MRLRSLALLLLAPLAACGPEETDPLGPADAGASQPDAAALDAAAPDAADPCAALEACPSLGATRCQGEQVETCERRGACDAWSAPADCTNGQCRDGACVSCEGTPGTFAEEVIEVEGEQRSYYLHVPDAYRCESAAPLLVDFHGTAGDQPELAYGLEAATALSDREGFLLARPRSRYSNEGGSRVYRWDQNPGDLRLNTTLAHLLVREIAKRYHLDPARVYAMGFSSGANMSSQLLAGAGGTYRGLAMVGGGTWVPQPARDVSAAPQRIYMVTGYRDYLLGSLFDFVELLARSHHPEASFFRRETDSGHELYGWQYGELWAWLDRAERPADGTLDPRWTRDPSAAAVSGSLIELATSTTGAVVAVGEGGLVVRRDALTGEWSQAARFQTPALTGACFLSSGRAVATGAGLAAASDDLGQTWRPLPAVPELAGQFFGVSYLNSVACRGSATVLGGGYWTGVRSEDGGEHWSLADMQLAGFAVPAQISSVGWGESGSAVAAGYFYLGRSADGVRFDALTAPVAADWLNDVAAGPGGRFWVVGERGTIITSDDDGLSWRAQQSGTERDLYAVSFLDANVGMAVGSHGTALLTEDGGQRWQDVSTGLDRTLADVAFLDAHRVLVVGERGTILWLAR